MNAAKGCSITGRLDTKNTKFTGHKEGRSHAKRRNANQYHTGRAENAPDMGHTHTAPQQNDALGGGGAPNALTHTTSWLMRVNYTIP